MEVEIVPGVDYGVDTFSVINTSGLPAATIREAFSNDPGMRDVAQQLSRWSDNLRAAKGRTSMFDRGMFTPADNYYAELAAARNAVEHDDVVSSIREITEAFAFQGMKIDGADDPDADDVFNQVAADLDMDTMIRKMWYEEYYSTQVILALSWTTKTYKPRTTTPQGKAKKKTYRIQVPESITVLDPARVVPLDFGPLMPEALGWMATDAEIEAFRQAVEARALLKPVEPPRYSEPEYFDALMAEFFLGLYKPTVAQAMELRELGADPYRILVMNPKLVVRHCGTKPDYRRWPTVRLKSLFPLLDLKRQLIAADRAHLVGAANYILLIRKGSKEQPATDKEMANLQENYTTIAKLPVIISDHRLEIEIVAPKIDLTLNSEKYDLIDRRLQGALLGTLSLGGSGQRNETNVTISYAVGRGMENRRHMLRRFVEKEILKEIVDRNEVFTKVPSMAFTPAQIQLGYDSALLQAVMALRTQREISRETILEMVGLDQATEARRREIEADSYDDVFQTLTMPGQSGDPNMQGDGSQGGTGEDPSVSGARGGRPQGGGKTPANPAKVRPKGPSGATKPANSSRASADDIEIDEDED